MTCVCRCILTEASCGDRHKLWICTRPEGHEGAHVACGGDVHRMKEWDDE